MKDIPFTSEVPKVPGAYWYQNLEGQRFLVELDKDNPYFVKVNGEEFHIDSFSGFWSPPLIPTSTLKTAVKEGFDDGYGIGVADGASNKFIREQRWAESNARKIVEGEG